MTKEQRKLYEEFGGLTPKERANVVMELLTLDEAEELGLIILERCGKDRKTQIIVDRLCGGFDYTN